MPRPSLEEIFQDKRPSLDEIFGGKTPKSDPEIGMGEAAGRGLFQGATLGFGDEITGSVGAAVDAAKKLSTSDLVEDYIRNRDKQRQANELAQKQHPWAYHGSEFAGGIVPLILPGLDIGAGATMAQRAGTAAKVGALAGLGAAKGDAKSQLESAVLGGALGATATPIIEKGIVPAVEGVGNYITGKSKDLAEDLAIRHLRPTPKVASTLGDEKLHDVAREALDSGAINFGSKIDNTLSNLSNLKSEAGSAIGDIVNSSDAKISPQSVVDKIEESVISPLRETSENAPIVKTLEDKVSNFISQYGDSMSPAQLENEKRAVQSGLNYATDSKGKQQAIKDFASVLRNESENAISDPAFNSAKRSYGNFANAEKMAERTASLTDGGTGLMGHITDVGAYGAGLHRLLSGDPTGLAIMGGRALTKGRMASSGAVAFDNVGNLLQKLSQNPNARRFTDVIRNAAMKGEESLATTHYLLGQTEPDYQNAVATESKDGKRPW